MEVKLEKMNCKLSCFEELAPLEYFKQLNIYQNLNFNSKNLDISNIDHTNPKIEVHSTKIIDTKITESIKGTSLEGQHLSGKNLIVVGNINMNLILEYFTKTKKIKNLKKRDIINFNMPFSTFIVIPEDTCNTDTVNLRYLIEDITIANISLNQVLASVTMLIQYID
ncbi:hypothetical protein GCM10008904_15920 [Paraclostridium ghonii]|uniref:DNA-binding transcriptional regulator YhcF (GntR family) n=1 Tax=Paraclostridium ghonii TaxID=29358 RepID=A0ABU0MZE7_9FIRM|nr:SPOCS domain-containing protein [Paeniclostridium ghonii]MDQ0556288.1 DNA-binding transcriptional regulator YhcF (GntR family) [Paeniclostridium ghonii]